MRLRSICPSSLLRWSRRHPVLSIFSAGLLVRLIGALLIWAANGHTSVISKVIVVIGVVLSVFGIGVLKWLSMRPRRKRTATDTAPDSPPPAV